VFPVTPATLLAWHRRLTEKMYDTSGGAGPAVLLETPEIKRLVLRLARRVHCGVIAGSRASC
jgi:transposase-like protein